ncbi:MAG: hypothetical protein IJU40_03715, partial [Desulfovibrionaceae bacterium]|nr:hypothetical protein [Desulfovibrionaceae bacterium]
MKKEPKSTTPTPNSNPNQNSNPNPKPNTDLLSEISSEVSQENAPLLEFINAHGSKIALAVGVVLIIAS